MIQEDLLHRLAAPLVALLAAVQNRQLLKIQEDLAAPLAAKLAALPKLQV